MSRSPWLVPVALALALLAPTARATAPHAAGAAALAGASDAPATLAHDKGVPEAPDAVS